LKDKAQTPVGESTPRDERELAKGDGGIAVAVIPDLLSLLSSKYPTSCSVSNWPSYQLSRDNANLRTASGFVLLPPPMTFQALECLAYLTCRDWMEALSYPDRGPYLIAFSGRAPDPTSAAQN